MKEVVGSSQRPGHDVEAAVRITRQDAAAALAHPGLRRIVLACAAREMSLAQMLRAWRTPLSTLHAQTAKLIALNLLRVARIKRRGGRPIRLFRAAAPAFLVPTSIIPVSPSAAYADELKESLAHAERLQDQQVLFSADAEGRSRMELVRGKEANDTAALELWCALNLRPQDVRELRQDLIALVTRYAERGRAAQAPAILLHVAFAPRRPRRQRRRV